MNSRYSGSASAGTAQQLTDRTSGIRISVDLCGLYQKSVLIKQAV
ncbi:hypothetical protein [Neisseria yangbaofengii]|nr:hypothetical protein [Neisseria yangbaofengii]